MSKDYPIRLFHSSLQFLFPFWILSERLIKALPMTLWEYKLQLGVVEHIEGLCQSYPAKISMLFRDLYLSCWCGCKIECDFFLWFHSITFEIRVIYFANVWVYIKHLYARLFQHFPDQSLNLAFSFFFVTLRKAPKAPPVSEKKEFSRLKVFMQIPVPDNCAYRLFKGHAKPTTTEANCKYNIVFLVKSILSNLPIAGVY